MEQQSVIPPDARARLEMWLAACSDDSSEAEGSPTHVAKQGNV